MNYLMSTLMLPIMAAYILLMSNVVGRYVLLRQKGSHLALILIITSICILFLASLLIGHVEHLETVTKSSNNKNIFYYIVEALIFLWRELVALLSLIDAHPLNAQSLETQPREDFNEISALSLFLALILGVFNLIVEYIGGGAVRRKMQTYLYRKFGGTKAATILKCLYEGNAVIFTLSSNKVYVGYILQLPQCGAPRIKTWSYFHYLAVTGMMH